MSDGSGDDDYVYPKKIYKLNSNTKPTRKEDKTLAAVNITGIRIHVRVDTCSDVNVIDEFTFAKFRTAVQLKTTRLNLFAYGQTTPLHVLGKFTEVVESTKGVCLTYFMS